VVVLVSAERGGPGAAVQGRRLARLARTFLGTLKLDAVELSLTLVRDAEIKKLNKRWRGKDQATDVLSFPAGEAVGPGLEMLGDLVISTQTAARAAKALGTRATDELSLYLAHGLLHLLGHDHHRPADARKMARLERKLLGGAGMLGRAGEG
jgi:probable rRNA maturation factor